MKGKLLLISPKFYDYDQYIANALKEYGFDVSAVTDGLYIGRFWRRVIWCGLSEAHKKSWTFRFFEKNITSDNDIIFVIKGSSISDDIMKMLKQRNPNARFVLYNYDAIKYSQHFLDLAGEFDYVATFDKADSEKYGWDYLPLFTRDNVPKGSERIYDITFIGSFFPKREQLVRRLVELADRRGYKCCLFLYCGLYTYIKKKITRDEVFKSVNRRYVAFHRMSMEKAQAIFSQSKCIADYTYPGQTGFMGRIMDSVGYRCKLITNNQWIRTADFYNENNVYIYDDDVFDLPEWFLSTPYEELPPQIYERYSIQNWIADLLIYPFERQDK